MSQLKLKKGMRALVVVAHPDDETIWMGGTILKHKDVDWTIFSLCRLSDLDREPKFRRVCALYGASSIMTDIEDEDRLGIEESIPLIKKTIIKKISKEKFDVIFTHGVNGEYGHKKHISIYRAVRELQKEGKLNCKNFFYFNYKKDSYSKRFPKLLPKKRSDYLVRLSRKIMHEKKRIVSEMHGYAWDGPDVSFCTNPEAFKQIKY